MSRPPDTTRHVEGLYRRLAPIYDVVWGLGLEPGRRQALKHLAPRPGERILEVGTGTGLSAIRYPPACQVVAVDLSGAMLERARARLTRKRIDHVALCRMDAGRLALADESFDAVYSPYLINVVADPIAAAREMLRVCRRGGRLVLLNHFRIEGQRSLVVDMLGAAATCAGVNWTLDLAQFLETLNIEPLIVEAVNLPKVSSVVVCRKP